MFDKRLNIIGFHIVWLYYLEWKSLVDSYNWIHHL